MPLAKRHFTVIATTGNPGRPALLLAAINPIRKLVVRDHVIELCGRLVVPGAPSLAAVDADGGALVAGQQDDPWILGIDPDGVIIVAARRAFDRGERLPSVGRAIRRRIRDIDDVPVLRIDPYAGEI